jgi:tetratricopeptide (TPR) repeat protein
MVLQRKRVANAERVRELVDAAFASRYQDLAAMLKISSRAVALAEEKILEIPSDLVVAAWTQYGNALRIAGRYAEAEKALDRATALPVSDPPTRIHLLEVSASLSRNTGRFESAAQFLTVAIASYRALGDSQSEARTYNLLGLVYFDWKNYPEALRAYRAALDLLEPNAPADVVATTGHNLVETLIEDGRLTAASSALALLEPLFRHFPPGSLTAKTEWLRARLCRGLKQYTAARLAYQRAYEILSTEPRSPDLAELLKEIAALPTDSGTAF